MADTEVKHPGFAPKCTTELHEYYGGACYHCCQTCNYNRHQCPGCGDDLLHDGRDYRTRKAHGDCT